MLLAKLVRWRFGIITCKLFAIVKDTQSQSHQHRCSTAIIFYEIVCNEKWSTDIRTSAYSVYAADSSD